jgi:hypothetical protein
MIYQASAHYFAFLSARLLEEILSINRINNSRTHMPFTCAVFPHATDHLSKKKGELLINPDERVRLSAEKCLLDSRAYRGAKEKPTSI